mmetsp:Transcript_1380/g.4466  ORF Transcript_1380/g.4466 Transcript_1380/m.4466 type:complete len:293 (-) Transcript_1380:795-1673(-)
MTHPRPSLDAPAPAQASARKNVGALLLLLLRLRGLLAPLLPSAPVQGVPPTEHHDQGERRCAADETHQRRGLHPRAEGARAASAGRRRQAAGDGHLPGAPPQAAELRGAPRGRVALRAEEAERLVEFAAPQPDSHGVRGHGAVDGPAVHVVAPAPHAAPATKGPQLPRSLVAWLAGGVDCCPVGEGDVLEPGAVAQVQDAVHDQARRQLARHLAPAPNPGRPLRAGHVFARPDVVTLPVQTRPRSAVAGKHDPVPAESARVDLAEVRVAALLAVPVQEGLRPCAASPCRWAA